MVQIAPDFISRVTNKGDINILETKIWCIFSIITQFALVSCTHLNFENKHWNLNWLSFYKINGQNMLKTAKMEKRMLKPYLVTDQDCPFICDHRNQACCDSNFICYFFTNILCNFKTLTFLIQLQMFLFRNNKFYLRFVCNLP